MASVQDRRSSRGSRGSCHEYDLQKADDDPEDTVPDDFADDDPERDSYNLEDTVPEDSFAGNAMPLFTQLLGEKVTVSHAPGDSVTSAYLGEVCAYGVWLLDRAHGNAPMFFPWSAIRWLRQAATQE